MEKIAVKHYGASLEKGKEVSSALRRTVRSLKALQIMQHFIYQLLEEGIMPDSIPRFRAKGATPGEIPPLPPVAEEERPPSAADSAIELGCVDAVELRALLSPHGAEREPATVHR